MIVLFYASLSSFNSQNLFGISLGLFGVSNKVQCPYLMVKAMDKLEMWYIFLISIPSPLFLPVLLTLALTTVKLAIEFSRFLITILSNTILKLGELPRCLLI